MSGRHLIAGLVLACTVLASSPAWAHGLLMKLRGSETGLAGELYYSNGTRAGGQWIEVSDETAPAPTETFKTRQDGSFEASAKPGHRYQVKATGDEGHEIVMDITLEGEARGQMVEPEAADGEEDEPIPAWALIGGGLLFSIIPALWLRRKSRRA